MASVMNSGPHDGSHITLYVSVYEYFHLRQISKQLGCYSPKMQQSSDNLSSVEFSEASNCDKILSFVESSVQRHDRTEPQCLWIATVAKYKKFRR